MSNKTINIILSAISSGLLLLLLNFLGSPLSLLQAGTIGFSIGILTTISFILGKEDK